jgi:hypothetical protein
MSSTTANVAQQSNMEFQVVPKETFIAIRHILLKAQEVLIHRNMFTEEDRRSRRCLGAINNVLFTVKDGNMKMSGDGDSFVQFPVTIKVKSDIGERLRDSIDLSKELLEELSKDRYPPFSLCKSPVVY